MKATHDTHGMLYSNRRDSKREIRRIRNYVHPRLKKYERDVISGRVPCPYRITFMRANGDVITTKPIRLTETGKPKNKQLFGAI